MSIIASITLGSQVVEVDPGTALPLAMLLGYGLARAGASAFQELRNAIFATVAQRAIRKVSSAPPATNSVQGSNLNALQVAGEVFEKLHQLDLQFHLNRSTGAVSRVMDRGSRSINFVLSSLLFNIVPTALEISLVSYVLATQFGWMHAGYARMVACDLQQGVAAGDLNEALLLLSRVCQGRHGHYRHLYYVHRTADSVANSVQEGYEPY
jgi:ABC-type multidrug transport system fused ATPase/permease subunit